MMTKVMLEVRSDGCGVVMVKVKMVVIGKEIEEVVVKMENL